MASSPAVFAQTYNATVNDLNTVFDPPQNIQGTICQSTDSDGIQNSSTACRDGVAASRWMAEKYAKKAGKYLGCIDGFYQGVWDGLQQGVNPSSDMVADAEAYVAGSTMESADLEARLMHRKQQKLNLQIKL